MTALGTNVVAPRDFISSVPYRPEGATVASGVTFTRGWHLMRDASGKAVIATESPTLLPGGFADRSLVTADAGNNDFINMETGITSVDMSSLSGDAFLDTDKPAPIYAINNNEFGKLPYNPSTGAPRSICGLFMRLDRPLTGSKCVAWIGPEGRAIAEGLAGTSIPAYDAVITTIAAFAAASGVITASANGAIGAQDTNVTLTAGMRVFLPVVTGGAGAGSVTAALSGPYMVINPGGASAKFVLARPPEWYSGMTIAGGTVFKIKPEGAIWGGNEWKAFPSAENLVVDTGDPVFWPKKYSADLTVAGANTTFWLKDTKSIAGVNKTSTGGWWASTLTAGQGNGAVTITGTAADHIEFTAINW